MSENLGTPAQRGVRVQEDDEAVRRRGRGGVGRRPPREISRLFVVTFSNVVWRDHLRAARVFDKPVKARPRICLPLAFVTLLVL